MEPWMSVLVALAIPLFGFLGALVTFKATKGKTQSDTRTAMEARIDKKVSEYMDDLEERAGKSEEKVKVLEEKHEDLERLYRDLKRDQEDSTHRENLLYRYISSLREHVVLQKPPPPPAIPPELEGWFDDLESTYPTRRGGA